MQYKATIKEINKDISINLKNEKRRLQEQLDNLNEQIKQQQLEMELLKLKLKEYELWAVQLSKMINEVKGCINND